MSITQYSLSWDSHKNNVCNGFTNLQQNEEFVDMTLAADGHLVKVHKSIFALASPYFKSILQSTSNDHPVVFLSSVSHEVLSYIVTYIYTGEVSVEVDKIHSFMRVAKDLRLSGLFGTALSKVGSEENKNNFHKNVKEQKQSIVESNSENQFEELIAPNKILINNDRTCELANVETLDLTRNINESNDKNIHEPEFISSDGIVNNRDRGFHLTADGYKYKIEISQGYHNKLPGITSSVPENTSNNPSELKQATSDVFTTIPTHDDNFCSFDNDNNITKDDTMNESLPPVSSLDINVLTPQYSMSNRGSLQLILNRYMYYCHHKSHGGRKRRWRCIDYRSKHCPAFIDTDGEIMITRKFGHAHSFHDEKITKKMLRNLIFTNLNILLEKNKKNKDAKQ